MEYLRLYGVSSERMRLCPLPVDVARFRSALSDLDEGKRVELRKRFQLAPDDFVVTFSGKLSERKRPQDLADAVRLLGDPRVKALFVGCGSLEEELRNRGGDFVRMTGFVNQQEIPRILALGDLAVMPSAYDPHPLAVTESLALGVPVLVSDLLGCYGPDDALRVGENGLVYRCGDIPALAGLIRRVKEDSSLLASMKKRAVDLIGTQTPQTAARAVRECLELLKDRSPIVYDSDVAESLQKTGSP
jgi:glycosyltransferase involved in cell wall biosynthesis